ncbi:DUF397 domain-containing protein [Actinoalloteichus sp. AHMU CJ021]|uniref:DUF397 domain-containing protein n=1 Tax=Actinoalloteichus caeruleus DSM 43889 TaxID=1120930 RepID=A0ABT1JF75_ACTCY|nr:DUF397 domain-containing protein [Actinoalloteichus caeruleus]AUS80427.1 DUF397 domain-containing protein [Actinoalloteichus sp. AHMU CJ021]MCP2331148.1 protein of unknown function (DUF397) [Actinoalloteichus caeruleus DSM 43889]
MQVDGEFGRWRKASRSGPQVECVEVGSNADHVAIRDTKNRGGGTLVVDHPTFGAFLTAVKDKRF